LGQIDANVIIVLATVEQRHVANLDPASSSAEIAAESDEENHQDGA